LKGERDYAVNASRYLKKRSQNKASFRAEGGVRGPKKGLRMTDANLISKRNRWKIAAPKKGKKPKGGL